MNVSTLRKPVAFLLAAGLFLFFNKAQAQVNAVIYGKNRIQYHKFDWRFYQTQNFNVYFTQNGLELSKFVLQVAEEELPSLEGFTEISLQRRANIILYNSYDDQQATNIGLGINNMPDVGGLTQLVNNKMVIHFNGDHENLRQQIRQGIARILVDNRLFGDNIGEVAGNAALLDLPKWLTDGYVSYAAQNWSPALDDALRNALLSGRYNSFYQLAFEEPVLAGHAFWNYIAKTYKKENVTYFLYLSILYKNTNTASQRIAKKKLKEVLRDFMQSESDLYYKDMRGRRAYPRGRIAVTEEVNRNTDFFRFSPNPNRRLYTWAVAEYKKGRYNVVLIQNYYNRKVLVSGGGVRVLKHQRNPNYPIMTWDGKGSRLAYVYWKEDKIWLEVFDIVANARRVKVDISKHFDQVQDVQYMLDANTLIFSAVKNGHTDIFMYKIDKETIDQLTDDVWDDVDGSFVSFPNKYGVIFASNRPGVDVNAGDTSIPSNNRYNIFMVDVVKKGGFRQISQLSKMQYGNARFPTQYNVNHFTFVSDANGISNRYAGFFTTKAAGLDTLVIVGDEILRNPERKELDSTLQAWGRSEPDSIGYIAVTSDSTYTFPITNYQSSLLETRIAGDIGQVSEVTRQGDYKFLYQLRVDSLTLYRRNVNPKPTPFMRGIQNNDRIAAGRANVYQKKDTTSVTINFFQSEFENEKPDSGAILRQQQDIAEQAPETQLSKARLYKYRLKFSADQVLAGVANNVLVTRYQPYGGGSGPIQLNNGNNLSFAFNATISDVMEDYRFSGGVKPSINFKDNEYYFSYENFRKRLDWGALYYKASNSNYAVSVGGVPTYNARLYTNLYQGNISYPFDVVRSLRLSAAYRQDRFVVLPSDRLSLGLEDQVQKYGITRLEYVHDNSLNMATNIWHGLRYKAYMEAIAQVKAVSGQKRQFTLNLGFDARHYQPLYRNLIWAIRAAGDASWGNQKLIYYLGGVDSWMWPKFNNANRPDPNMNYAYQTLAVNMRGFQQNVANGNNALVINNEFRVPVFSTFFNKPINNAFLRNFQLTQFVDLGSAWAGTFKGIKRPLTVYQDPASPAVSIEKRAGGIGPFVGGYGFGARSTLLGYFLKADAGWPMDGIFKGKPMWYFSMGLDF